MELYNSTLTCILDKHSPVVTRKCKVNKTPWWNNECQEARTTRRRANRAYKKHPNPETDTHFRECSIDAAIIINRERNRFYHGKLDSLAGNQRETYKVVNKLLDKQYGKNVFPNGDSDESIANNLKNYFHSKVNNIYSDIEADCHQYFGSNQGGLSNEDVSSTVQSMTCLSSLSQNDLIELIMSMPNKSCSMDAIPLWLLKECLPELIPMLSFIVNKSLATGVFPTSLKAAVVKPSLKKPNIDADDVSNYRPISNLTTLSKIIEKCVHKQLVTYIDNHGLFAKFQSGYRKAHSCETAITKIHNDIMLMIDKKRNVVLLLLDLSAAFDTINHSLLLRKLKSLYGINGTVLCWIESYLSERSFRVSVNKSVSSSCPLNIGVPQGSILGPLLFILYTKDLHDVVSKYGLSIHLYADDTQIYFSFDVNCPNPNMSDIQGCFTEIKQWMALKFLKLNDNKTDFMEIGVYESCIGSLPLGSLSINPSEKAKNLGFMFD